jgi:hypothetical protein
MLLLASSQSSRGGAWRNPGGHEGILLRSNDCAGHEERSRHPTTRHNLYNGLRIHTIGVGNNGEAPQETQDDRTGEARDKNEQRWYIPEESEAQ